MNFVKEYISHCYITLTLLAGLTVILIANRKTKLQGTQFIWSIMGLVFVLTSCEYLEYWCDTYDKPLWILYLKTTLVYLIYPLIIMLELYLIAPIRHKLLAAIPYAVYTVIVLLNLCGLHLIYFFHPDHAFSGSVLRMLPTCIMIFYLILLTRYSPEFIKNGKRSKSLIVIFMALSTVLTAFLELEQIAIDHTDEIAAIDVLIYYFYLAAIYRSDLQGELYHKELELEKSKMTLLMAQIKPHFINNAMIAVQELCYEEPEKAAELIHHFSRYLRNNINATDGNMPITFEKEIEAVNEYLAIEYADSRKLFKVDFDLQVTGFLIPALTVEPLVENAVKHGVDRYSAESRIVISSRDIGEHYLVEIRDNGKGFDVNAETLGKDGIGLKNVISRLKMMCGGELTVDRADGWTVAAIKIPKRRDTNADDNS